MLLLLLGSCVHPAPPPPLSEPAFADPASPGVSSPELAALVTAHWEATMARAPTWATALGDHRYDDRWPDPSADAELRWLEGLRRTELGLALLGDDTLSRADRLTRDLLLETVRSELRSAPCRFAEWSFSARDNVLVELRDAVEDAPVADEAALGRLLARYHAFPAHVDGTIARLEAGLAAGRVTNRESAARVVAMFDEALAGDVDGAIEVDAPTEAAAALGERGPAVAAALRAAVVDEVRPALARYRDLVRDRLLPAARDGAAIGLGALPDGDVCYAARIRAETTLDRTPAELHQLGLDEIAKIHAEFRVLGARVFGTEDLAEIFRRLREDPALRFGTAAEITATAEGALRRAEAAVPGAFGIRPAAPCEVAVVPDYLAPYATIAWYDPGTPGEQVARYFVNASEPGSRPRPEAEVLAFHESVPGHHLQIAIARETGEVPPFRRHAGYGAFVEGWALYVERLADELGLYSGDVDRLGMLSFDAWRAGRLVVDTGLHAEGWTREAAEAWFLENTPLAPNNVRNEVDRYVTWPGQALAYKTGQLEILALRREAEARLGDRFALADFHDVVLGAGAVPLPILRERVERWLDEAAP